MLYIVAIAICSLNIAEEECSHVVADRFVRYWYYRPTQELCLEYARDMIAATGLVEPDQYAKVYCVRAETFQEAETTIIR